MKRIICNSLSLSVLFLLGTQTILSAQSIEIDYKTRLRSVYSVTIYFSNHDGSENIQPGDFLDYENIYFTITTNPQSQRDHFRMSDLDDLGLINIYQEGNMIHQSDEFKLLDYDEGKVTTVLMTFPKDKIKLYKPFVFINTMDTSEPIQLDEKFFEHYETYHRMYLEGQGHYDDNLYFEAFKSFFPIAQDGTAKEELLHYSFFADASEKQIENIITKYSDSLFSVFSAIHDEFSNTMQFSALHQGDSVRNLLVMGYDVFTPYFELNYPKSKLLKTDYTILLDSINSILKDNSQAFKENTLSFLEKGKHEEFKFRFFIDAIARLMTYIESFKIIDGLNKLDLVHLDDLPHIKQTLIQTEWLEDFEIYVYLINENIENNQQIFNDATMTNLHNQMAFQHQPYYQLFSAFNSLASNDELFYEYLNDAVKYCSDVEIIKRGEMWLLSYDYTNRNINPATITSINNGLSPIFEQNWSEASEAFNIISMQAGHLAPPWYYGAVADFEQGNIFSARSKINHALDRNPGYISPRLYLFEWMKQEERYEELFENINQSLQELDIWLFHYWKAKTLMAAGLYQEVIERITQYCHHLNPYDVHSWFLLGDAYLSLAEENQARQAYERTQQIDPFNYSDIFNTKMNVLMERVMHRPETE